MDSSETPAQPLAAIASPTTTDEPQQIERDPDTLKWKKNSLFLYDTLLTHSLEWPSLTCQWLPVVTRTDSKSKHRLILGTHTSSSEQQNYLIIASVEIPNDDILFDDSQFYQDRDEYGGYGTIPNGKVEIDVKIKHKGEVNKARFVPQTPHVIATKSPNSEVYIFDFTKHPSNPRANGAFEPQLTLRGHTQEGFGLAWNNFLSGHLLSAGYDGTICHWDISSTTYDSSALDPLNIYSGHCDKVCDVAWHRMHPNVFGSSSDDKTLMIWDTRTDTKKDFSLQFCGHTHEVNCLAFSFFNQYIFASGSSDESIGFWDLRSPKTMFHSIKSSPVFQLEWSPQFETLLSSTGGDKYINLWNLQYSNDSSSKDKSDMPPELVFTHVGHTETVSEFSWNYNDPLLGCSVSEDNSLHIWQPSINV